MRKAGRASGKAGRASGKAGRASGKAGRASGRKTKEEVVEDEAVEEKQEDEMAKN